MVAMEQPSTQPVTELLLKYLAAKAAETAAEELRVDLGNQIAKALGAPQEGSKTHNVDGYLVKLTGKINRSVDWDVLDVVFENLPGVHAPVRTKRELDVTGLRWIQDNQPDVYLQLSRAITATPGRVSVEVKELAK